ncbi:hypothetical protein D3C81_1398060 [compost metagenome]
MLLNYFACANLRRFLKRNRFLKPRCGNHARPVFILVALCAFDGIPYTIDQPDIHFKAFRNLDLHRVVRHKFRLRCHDCFASCALRQFIHSSYPVCFARNVRQNNRLHEAFDECRFPRANRADDAKINVSAGTLGNVLENIHFFQKRSPPHITPKKKCLKSIDFAFRRLF